MRRTSGRGTLPREVAARRFAPRRGDTASGARGRAGGPSAVVRAVVLAAGLLALTATAGFAGEPAAPGGQGLELGFGVLAATGLGSMSCDLNRHPGFGFVLQGYLPVASRLELRPSFEWTGYRVNEYNLAALALVELLGGSYEDTRVVFRTYRLGLDGIVYFREQYRGPFLSGGVGVQLSQTSIEDVAHYANGEEDVTPLRASSATTGLWLGGGVGYAWPGANVELRLSRAPYGFAEHRSTSGRGNALPLQVRPGWALHVIFAVRSRAKEPAPAPTTE